MDENFLDGLANVLNQLDERLSAVEHSVNDVIISSLKEASDEYEYDDGLNAFKEKYADIEGLIPQLKALYGDDYDAYKNFYDSSRSHMNDDGYDEAAFVKNTIDGVRGRFDALKGVEKPVVEEIVVEKNDEEKGEDSNDFPGEEQLAKELAQML